MAKTHTTELIEQLMGAMREAKTPALKLEIAKELNPLIARYRRQYKRKKREAETTDKLASIR